MSRSQAVVLLCCLVLYSIGLIDLIMYTGYDVPSSQSSGGSGRLCPI